MAYQRLGKFDSARDELLYDLLATNEWADEHEGHQEDFGAYAWACTILKPISPQDEALIHHLAKQIDADDAELPNQVYGHWVVSVNSQGFVHVEKMNSKDDLDALWTAYMASFERWSEQQEEE